MTSEYTAAVDKLIDDHIYEILLRLPVKSLLRFKSVSKPWLSLISNPNFIKSHTMRKRKAADEAALIVLHDRLMYPLNLDSYEIESCIGFHYSRYVEEEQPYYTSTTVVGCYNGVVCVCLIDARYRHNAFWDNIYNHPQIYLWNPATKQTKFASRNIIGDTKFLRHVDYKIRSVRTGFGFDPQSNDFKVVRVVRFYNKPICAEVYSANNDGWRVYDEPNLVDVHYRFNVCVDGFLCYLGSNGMMVFDLNKEVFKTGVNLPVVDDSSVHIMEVNDLIAVVAISKDDEGLYGSSKIRLWTLDDNACLLIGGGEAVWTQMLCIDVRIERRVVNVYFNRGDLILVCEYNCWYVYDTHKKWARPLRIYDQVPSRHFFKYKASLITIPRSTSTYEMECLGK